MKLLKIIKHTFRNTNDGKDFASPCNINSFDGVENGGGCLGSLKAQYHLLCTALQPFKQKTG